MARTRASSRRASGRNTPAGNMSVDKPEERGGPVGMVGEGRGDIRMEGPGPEEDAHTATTSAPSSITLPAEPFGSETLGLQRVYTEPAFGYLDTTSSSSSSRSNSIQQAQRALDLGYQHQGYTASTDYHYHQNYYPAAHYGQAYYPPSPGTSLTLTGQNTTYNSSNSPEAHPSTTSFSLEPTTSDTRPFPTIILHNTTPQPSTVDLLPTMSLPRNSTLDFRSMTSALIPLRDLLPVSTPLLNAAQPTFRFRTLQLLTNVLTLSNLITALKSYRVELEAYAEAEVERLVVVGDLGGLEALRVECQNAGQGLARAMQGVVRAETSDVEYEAVMGVLEVAAKFRRVDELAARKGRDLRRMEA